MSIVTMWIVNKSYHIGLNISFYIIEYNMETENNNKGEGRRMKREYTNYGKVVRDIQRVFDGWEIFTQLDVEDKLELPPKKAWRALTKAHSLGIVRVVGRNRPYVYKLKKNYRLKSADLPPNSIFLRGGLTNLEIGNTKEINVHAVTLKMPIVMDSDVPWEKEVDMNNWVKKMVSMPWPYDIKLAKTTKNVIAYLSPKDFDFGPKFAEEYKDWAWRSADLVRQFLDDKFGVKVTLFGTEIIDQHIATPMPEAGFEKGPRVEVAVGGQATSPFGDMRQDAKAWVDDTPHPDCVETNSVKYKQQFLAMPGKVEAIHSLFPQFADINDKFSKNLELHLKVLQDIGNALKPVTFRDRVRWLFFGR